MFYVPTFTPGLLLLRLSEQNSAGSEIAFKKLLFLGRLINDSEMVQAANSLFMSRTETYFDDSVTSIDVLFGIVEAIIIHAQFVSFLKLVSWW